MVLRLTPPTLLLIAISIATPTSAKELWQRRWVEVRSPHFVFVSALDEAQTVEVARDLERFRVAVATITNIGVFEERVPTTIYMLPKPVTGIDSGYDFIPGMRSNYGVVIPAGRPPEGLVNHVYLHLALYSGTQDYPPWLAMGLVELFSTTTARGKVIRYGQPLGRKFYLPTTERWVPLKLLLGLRYGTDVDDMTATFNAQSWQLVHYLKFGRRGNFADDTATYLRRVETGAEPADAFSSAYGLELQSVRAILLNYLNHKIRPTEIALSQALPEAPVDVAPVTADSIAAQLGTLLVHRDEIPEARRYLDAALKLNPNNVSALVGLGTLQTRAGHFDDARPYYEKALELEPNNPHAQLDYAEFFLACAKGAEQPAEIANNLTMARRHFARSYELDPKNPETLAMNGSSYMFPGEPLGKALASLIAAHTMLPNDARITFLLAQAYAMSGKTNEAAPLLRSLAAWGDVGTAHTAAKMLEQLPHSAAISDALPGAE